MAKRKCRHAGSTVITWKPGSDEVFSMRCSPTIGCGAQLSLGPSNDEPIAVQIEIRAAEIALWETVDQLRVIEEVNGVEWSGAVCHVDSTDPDPAAWPGWLAREIVTHPDRKYRDYGSWSWSIERPIAGQWPALATVLGAKDPNEDALRDPDITERNARVFAERNAAALSAALADANAVISRTEAAVKEMAVAFAAMADEAEHETTDKRFDDSEEG